MPSTVFYKAGAIGEVLLENGSPPHNVQVVTDEKTADIRVDQLHGGLTIPTTCVFIVGILAGSGFLALPKSIDNAAYTHPVIYIGRLLVVLIGLPLAAWIGQVWTYTFKAYTHPVIYIGRLLVVLIGLPLAAWIGQVWTYTFKGWVGIILLFLFCFLSIYTSTVLGRLWVILLERGLLPTSGHVRYPYPAIGEAAYGTLGKYLISGAINFTNFGTVVVYVLLASENIELLLSTSFSFCYIGLIVTVVILPVTWLGSPKEFWWTALGATMTTFTASVIVMSNTIKDRDRHPVVEHTDVDFVSFFTAFGTIAFSYTGHPIFPTIQADMRRPQEFGKAAFIGYMLCLAIYIPSSVASYFIYGKHVDANVLATLSAGPMKNIATALMTCHLLLGIVIIINPVCQEMEHVLKIPNRFTWKRALARVVIMMCVVIVVETLPHFSAILALVGGSTITLLGCICPPLFYLKLCSIQPTAEDAWKPRHLSLATKVMNVEIMLVGVVCGAAATYSAIHDLVHSSFSMPCYVNVRSANV